MARRGDYSIENLMQRMREASMRENERRVVVTPSPEVPPEILEPHPFTWVIDDPNEPGEPISLRDMYREVVDPRAADPRRLTMRERREARREPEQGSRNIGMNFTYAQEIANRLFEGLGVRARPDREETDNTKYYTRIRKLEDEILSLEDELEQVEYENRKLREAVQNNFLGQLITMPG